MDNRSKPTGFGLDFQTAAVALIRNTIICSMVDFGEDFLTGRGMDGVDWQIAQQNALFHNFSPPTASTPSKFFKLYYISLY